MRRMVRKPHLYRPWNRSPKRDVYTYLTPALELVGAILLAPAVIACMNMLGAMAGK